MTTENSPSQKPMVEPVNRTLATLASLEIRRNETDESSRPSHAGSKKVIPADRLLRTEWQQRNLNLEVTHPAVQEAADAVTSLAGMIGRNDALVPLVVLYGEPGCGKTHLGRKMVNWAHRESFGLWERKVLKNTLSVLSVNWPAVCDSFKEGFYGIVDDLIRDDFVFIDDIGAEHDPSKNATDKLCQVLSRRESKWTLITTNLAPSAWAEKWDSRVADRLLRRSTIVDMSKVPSYATIA